MHKRIIAIPMYSLESLLLGAVYSVCPIQRIFHISKLRWNQLSTSLTATNIKYNTLIKGECRENPQGGGVYFQRQRQREREREYGAAGY